MRAEEPAGVLLLDKPEGWTSTRALARAKRLLGARKAGHTGTLDPFATGLLPLVFGEATKFSRFLIDSTKSYHATLRLGQETTTGDTEGVPVGPSRQVALDPARIDQVLRGFLGAGEQVPPMHSAVHFGGKRLYEFAREGLEVPRAARPIAIESLRRESFDGDRLEVSVTCSKGTYVRTLAADIGRTLGCGAYLTGLRRTAVGTLRVQDSASLETLEAAGVEGARRRLLPLEVLIAGLPRFEAAAQDALRFRQGQAISCEGADPGSEWAVHGPDGAFLGVATAPGAGLLAPLRLLATGKPEAPDFP